MAAPPRRNHMFLVERNSAVIVQITRDIMVNIQMPRTFWYWSLYHAVQAQNYPYVTVNGNIITLFELIHGVKPDYRTLFFLFSTEYFEHTKDSEYRQFNVES